MNESVEALYHYQLKDGKITVAACKVHHKTPTGGYRLADSEGNAANGKLISPVYDELDPAFNRCRLDAIWLTRRDDAYAVRCFQALHQRRLDDLARRVACERNALLACERAVQEVTEDA